jgi:hypothetical protein
VIKITLYAIAQFESHSRAEKDENSVSNAKNTSTKNLLSKDDQPFLTRRAASSIGRERPFGKMSSTSNLARYEPDVPCE